MELTVPKDNIAHKICADSSRQKSTRLETQQKISIQNHYATKKQNSQMEILDHENDFVDYSKY